MIIKSYEDIDKCENNEATKIMLNIDKIERKDFINFFHLLLGKLRHGGTLTLTGTSLTLFCKLVLIHPNKRTVLVERIREAYCFHDMFEVETIV